MWSVPDVNHVSGSDQPTMSGKPTNLPSTQSHIAQRIPPSLAQGAPQRQPSLRIVEPIEPIGQPTFIWTSMYLACPARVERASYALEEFVAAQKAKNFNSLQRKNGTV